MYICEACGASEFEPSPNCRARIHPKENLLESAPLGTLKAFSSHPSNSSRDGIPLDAKTAALAKRFAVNRDRYPVSEFAEEHEEQPELQFAQQMIANLKRNIEESVYEIQVYIKEHNLDLELTLTHHNEDGTNEHLR